MKDRIKLLSSRSCDQNLKLAVSQKRDDLHTKQINLLGPIGRTAEQSEWNVKEVLLTYNYVSGQPIFRCK